MVCTVFAKSLFPAGAMFGCILNRGDGEVERTPVLVLVAIALSILIGMIVRNSFIGTYVVLGTSMADTLQQYDLLLVWKGPITLHRGDLVILHRKEGGRNMVKRVVALPGETVEIRRGAVLVDGRFLSPPATGRPAQCDDHEFDSACSAPPRLMAPNQFFVLGDNQENSMDSRFFGGVDRSEILGKILMKLWPPRIAGAFSVP
jgi:signal peptidase I